MTYWYTLLAIIGGAFLPIQVGVNNTLRAGVGNSILAAFISFIVGTICLVALLLCLRTPLPPMQALSSLPGWAWVGGILGAYFVTSGAFLAPKLGAATLVSITVAAQLCMSLLLDHYGAVGFAQHGINGWRIAGAAMLIAGSLLILKN